MILKNKTNAHQSVRTKDGLKHTARPYRTITINEKLDYNKSVWEEEKVEKKSVEVKE